MNLYKVVPAYAVVASMVLAACTSDDSSGSASYGEEKYSRVLTKGNGDSPNASMVCKVYEQDGCVTLTMDLDLPLYSSDMKMKIETITGDPSVYRVDVEMTGITLDALEETCSSITESLAALGGSTNCTDSGVHGVQEFAAATTSAMVQYVVSSAIASGV